VPRATTLLATAALTLAGTAGGWAAATGSSAAAALPTISIGATNFSEQVIVADLYSDVLQHAGFKTTVHTGGTRAAVEPALAKGDIDLYPDYAGSLLVFLKPKDTAQATQLSTDVPALKAALAPSGATVLTPSKALDTNVFAVTKATASKYHLTTLSSLAKVAPQLVFGAPSECTTYYYCLPGLQKVYGLKFKSFVSTDEAGPIAVADLKNDKVQVVELFSSNGAVVENGFVQLVDNKHLEPVDFLVPVIRKSVDTPAVAKVLNAMDAKLTTVQLEHLNIEFSNNHEPETTIASKWLKSQGLI
jgi:osmoprotectant transport system substrate-binding protein